jgi:hypothetical protein
MVNRPDERESPSELCCCSFRLHAGGGRLGVVGGAATQCLFDVTHDAAVQKQLQHADTYMLQGLLTRPGCSVICEPSQLRTTSPFK